MAIARPGGSLPLRAPESSKGRYVARHMKDGSVVIQGPPRKRPKPTGAFDYKQRIMFTWLEHQTRLLEPIMRQSCEYLAKGTIWTWRDIASMMILGTYYAIEAPDGTIIEGARLSQPDPQFILDLITKVAGSIIYRDTNAWYGLAPGDDGDVLTLAGGLPAWATPTGGGGGSSPDYEIPAAALFATLVNTPTLADTPRGLAITGIGTNGTLSMALQNFDSTHDATFISRVLLDWRNQGNDGVYMLMRNSAGGHVIGAGLTRSNEYEAYWEGTLWNDENSYQSGSGGAVQGVTPAWVWLQWTQATHTIDAYTSNNGAIWRQNFSNSAWLTNPDQIGFGVSCRTGGAPGFGAITYFGNSLS